MRETSAGAVVFRREGKRHRYLILHYTAGHWDFPKGKIEEGEEMEQTVVREAREETGISDLEFVPGFHEKISYFLTREGNRIFKTVDFFLAQTEEEDVTLSSEHIGFGWLLFEDALGQLTHENAKKVLQKAEAFLSKK